MVLTLPVAQRRTTFGFVGSFPTRRCRRAAGAPSVATGAVGPDGALYFPTQVLRGTLGLAISRDEGATWHLSSDHIAEVSGPFAIVIDRRAPRQPLLRLDRQQGGLPYG